MGNTTRRIFDPGRWTEDNTNFGPLLFDSMQRFSEGDPVRVDIPDETDPDQERYHGLRGTVVDVFEDDAGLATGDERDSLFYRIEFEDGHKEDFRWRDLRPP